MRYKGLKFGTVPLCPGAPQPAWIANAWQDILPQGHAEHFVNGSEGLTWLCALRHVIMDPENRHLIPHPVHEAFITGKTVCFIMTGEKHKGVFIFIKYAHNYGQYLDLNDAHLSQRQAKETPEIFEQKFLFSVPVKKKRIKAQSNRRASSPRKPFRVKGATARAVAAGLMSETEAREMASTMDAYERQRLASVRSRRV
jgi:hypothetical protein